MANQEVFGGLISAMSRGESIHKAMLSLFNAGYKREEIEEAARLLQFQTPTQIIQKQVEEHKQISSGKIKPSEKSIIVAPNVLTPVSETKKSEEKGKPDKQEEVKKTEELKKQTKQNVSQYSGEKNPEEFKKIIGDAIKSLQILKSPVQIVKSGEDFKPPIIIQRVSGYDSKPKKPVNKSVIWVLFILLILLLGSLVALFVFKEKLIEIFNNLSL